MARRRAARTLPPHGFASPADAIAAARERASARSDRQRETTAAEPVGVYTGIDAEHPLTGARVPVFAAEHVLAGYGSGAVMGVPAHDARDFALARALSIPVVAVVRPPRCLAGGARPASRMRRPRSGRRRTPGTASRPAPAAPPTAGPAARSPTRSCAS